MSPGHTSGTALLALKIRFLTVEKVYLVGEHFKTDTEQLDRFVKTLQGSVSDLDEARKALAHVRADQVGTGRLDEACDTFQERWKYGSEQLSEMIGTISEGVEENKRSYEEMENNLEKSLDKMADEATSGGDGKGGK